MVNVEVEGRGGGVLNDWVVESKFKTRVFRVVAVAEIESEMIEDEARQEVLINGTDQSCGITILA